MATDAARDQLRLQLMMACGGHPMPVAYEACVSALASVIGLTTSDQRVAEAVCDQAAADLKSAISLNWQEISRVRAIAVEAGHA